MPKLVQRIGGKTGFDSGLAYADIKLKNDTDQGGVTLNLHWCI